MSRNRFCDFLADPGSRNFSRFYTNIPRSRYGIYGAGLTRSLFRRLQINDMSRDGAIFWYCWYNRIEDSAIWGCGIGVHSACNNMRITGSDLHSHTVTAILLDGGSAIDIVGNLIEGNQG